MSKSEAQTVLDRAVGYGCNGVIKQLTDGSWRVYVSKAGRWIFVVSDDDFDDALENPELWVKGRV